MGVRIKRQNRLLKLMLKDSEQRSRPNLKMQIEEVLALASLILRRLEREEL